MAQVVVLMAGMLFISGSQARNEAERSTHQGFLSNHVPPGSDLSQSSISDYDNFITPNFNRVKHGNGPFTTVDDKPVPHSSTQVQDSNNNISPISLTAIGIGMLSIVTMLVVRLRRGLQPATALGDNLMEMKSQDSNVKVNSGRVGWGQLSSQSPQPLTPCYASKQEMAALAEANPDFLGKSLGLWDPLNCLDFDFW